MCHFCAVIGDRLDFPLGPQVNWELGNLQFFIDEHPELNDLPEWEDFSMTAKEVAELLSCSTSTVYRLARQEKLLPYRRFDLGISRWLIIFKRGDVLNFMSDRKRKKESVAM